MRFLIYFLLVLLLFNCKKSTSKKEPIQVHADLAAISSKDFREFKVLDSKYINLSELWAPFEKDLKGFTEDSYNNLKPLILEQDIPTLQSYIEQGDLSYERLTMFYLYRIRKYDRENEFSLNSVISLNPNVIVQARELDHMEDFDIEKRHPIFGMPILLKDNINVSNSPTTAGAVALKNNMAKDAFVVKKLKAKGAIILGKANLSEWAYFFCGDCPSGYSAIGGQTLNPYGRRIMDTGGSSSGSGVAVASNFCVAAIGSETSGSILSPSSQNSVVGLKPTIGLVSRSGIVPISSTLDTSGPMTKNVMDNAILLDAMLGYDKTDVKSLNQILNILVNFENSPNASLKGKRFGAFRKLLDDSLYVDAISDLKSQGAFVIEIDEEHMELPDFVRLLNLDMKADLPIYLSKYAGKDLTISSVEDVIDFNKKDSLNRMPYGQKLFHGILADEATEEDYENIKKILKANGQDFFDKPLEAHNLDGFLSINNYHAGFAAVAEYPALTVPMGYTKEGVPKGLTFISKPLSEEKLLKWAYLYEQKSKKRKLPVNYN
jgi:amidase